MLCLVQEQSSSRARAEAPPVSPSLEQNRCLGQHCFPQPFRWEVEQVSGTLSPWKFGETAAHQIGEIQLVLGRERRQIYSSKN